MEAVDPVEHAHIKRGGRGAFFLIAVDVEVAVVGASVGEPMNEPRIAVVGEDYGLICGKECIKVSVWQSVWTNSVVL